MFQKPKTIKVVENQNFSSPKLNESFKKSIQKKKNQDTIPSEDQSMIGFQNSRSSIGFQKN